MKPWFMLTAALIVLVTPAYGKDTGFKGVVRGMEAHFRVARSNIDTLERSAREMAKPNGVKSLRVAVLEDRRFLSGSQVKFKALLEDALDAKWRPLVQERSSEETIFIYALESRRDVRLLNVILERHQAIVLEAKVGAKYFSRMIQTPDAVGPTMVTDLIREPPLPQRDRGRTQDERSAAGVLAVRTLFGAEATPRPAHASTEPSRSPTRASRSATTHPARGGMSSVIRVESQLVNLNVRAANRFGTPLTLLSKNDFRVFEEGVEQRIRFFEPVSAPINMVLLMDLSGSTKRTRKLMVKAAKKFVDYLDSDDRIAVAGFTSQFFQVSGFTTERKQLKKRIDEIKNLQGGTAFYDAMWQTLDMMHNLSKPRKAIVVLTDGEDNAITGNRQFASRHSFRELLARILQEDVSIYPIYTRGEDPSDFLDKLTNVPEELLAKIQMQWSRPQKIAHQQLQAIAQAAAGTLFIARRFEDLEGVYERVAGELQLLYSLAYDPVNAERDGSFRRIEVDVSGKGSIAKTRPGYFAR